ncbi:MAG: DUF1080 domain-containing protein [Tyzzerella sp.]|nr:DUF1080 domain-containing protein [Tyzzerella sp.]
MKRLKMVMLTLLLLISTVATNMTAYAQEDVVDMLSTKADWSLYENDFSIITLEDGVMSITPSDAKSGGVYTADSYSNAVIEFEYQISYDPSVEPYDEEDGAFLPGSFWGIIFGYQVTIDDQWNSKNIMPWYTQESYPYMLCFDTERQTSDTNSGRYTQVGLSIRRYNALGGHDYAARWSTVDPGDFEYLASNGRMGKSVTPEYYKPITVSDCFDTDKHKVKMEYHAEYIADGAKKDAIVINVWFDGELVLTVVDEMPFKGESWGTEVDVDKRKQKGYIGVFAHNAMVSDADLYDWKVDIFSLKVSSQDDGSTGNGSANTPNTDNGTNKVLDTQTIIVAGVIVGAVILVVIGVVIISKKGKRTHEE